MTTFVLIHGAAHGGWCWGHVIRLLQTKGNVVVAPDLPGVADDPATLGHVDLAMTAEFVADVVRAQAEPVVLVGHSMGGIAISETAERVPERIKGLIYVAAMLVPKGRCLQDSVGESGTNASLVLSPDGRSMRCDPEFATAIFYNRTDPARAKDAVSRLRSQLLLPATEPLTVSQARFGSLPRAYIECLDDKAIPIAIQRRMQADLPCDPVVTFDTDHSPFLSMPETLAAALMDIAGRFASSR